MKFDFCIVGGGIVGLSSAMRLGALYPGAAILVVEKEDAVAVHQTGRNSGVIHAGVYYAPGSLKARFCREGLADTMAFCREHDLPFEQCGKLLVATTAEELVNMGALAERAGRNGLAVERLDAAELRRREPNISGLGALFVADTGIVNYGEVARAMARTIAGRGGEVRTGTQVLAVRETGAGVELDTAQGAISAKVALLCGGLQSDRLARQAGIDIDFQIVPFRGDYFRLPAARSGLIRHLIYPIPDPKLPFLGVHLTRMIDGSITVGPNAAVAFAREGYGRTSLNVADSLAMASFPGFWKVLAKHGRSAWNETMSALSRQRYLDLCRRYCPELTLADLEPHPSGIRAQAVMADGTLVHDFLVRETARTVHVCNAPSPACTAALPIGRHIASLAQQKTTALQ